MNKRLSKFKEECINILGRWSNEAQPEIESTPYIVKRHDPFQRMISQNPYLINESVHPKEEEVEDMIGEDPNLV